MEESRREGVGGEGGDDGEACEGEVGASEKWQHSIDFHGGLGSYARSKLTSRLEMERVWGEEAGGLRGRRDLVGVDLELEVSLHSASIPELHRI